MKINEVFELKDGTEVHTKYHDFIKKYNGLYEKNTNISVMDIYTLNGLLTEEFEVENIYKSFNELPYDKIFTVTDIETEEVFDGYKILVFGEPLLIIKDTNEDRLYSYDTFELKGIDYFRFTEKRRT